MRSAKLAIVVLCFAYAAFGQTGGTITGVISDPTGAVVANAPIEAKNAATGVVLPAATSATGNYELGDLPAGTYEIAVTVPGFKKYVRTGITVQELQTTRVDVTLQVGAATDAVTVVDVAPLLKTETGEISHNVTTTTVDDLPVGSIGTIRVTTLVVQMLPGVNANSTHRACHQWLAGRHRTDPHRRPGRNLQLGEHLLLVRSAQRGFGPGGRDTNQ